MLLFKILKKPFINSIPNEISNKLKTPFVLTFVIVWIIYKRVFLYDLILNKTADKRTLLIDNLNIIDLDFYFEICKVSGLSFILLIIFYVFLNISRLITLFLEERVKLNLVKSINGTENTDNEDVNYWKTKLRELKKSYKDLKDELDSIKSKNQSFKKID